MRQHPLIAQPGDKFMGGITAVRSVRARREAAFFNCPICLTATSASEGPTAGCTANETHSPWGFSMVASPVNASFASLPSPLRTSFAAGSVADFMGVVTAALVFEVCPVVAVAWSALGLLVFKTLQRRPSLDQRRVYRKVIVGNPAILLCQPAHL